MKTHSKLVLISLAFAILACFLLGGCGTEDKADNRKLDDGWRPRDEQKVAAAQGQPELAPGDTATRPGDMHHDGWPPVDGSQPSPAYRPTDPDATWTPHETTPARQPLPETSRLAAERDPRFSAPHVVEEPVQPVPYRPQSMMPPPSAAELRPMEPKREPLRAVQPMERPVDLQPYRITATEPNETRPAPPREAMQPRTYVRPVETPGAASVPFEAARVQPPVATERKITSQPLDVSAMHKVRPPAAEPPRQGTTIRLVPPRPTQPATDTAAADTAVAAPHVAAEPLSSNDNSPAMAPTAEPAAVDENFHRVNVFYGTDRASLSEMDRSQRDYLDWLKWAAVALGCTVGIAVLNFRSGAGRVSRLLLLVGILATCGLGGWTTVRWLQYVPLSEQPNFVYGGARGELKFGTCEVSIPKDHQVGRVEAPSLMRLEFQADPEKHVKLLAVDELPEQQFFDRLRQRVSDSAVKQAFVFVHGYNVSFDDAVRRTAQLAFDLNFDGAPICYSWPSQAEYLGYSTDEGNVIWTESDLERFLLEILNRSGAERIHLIAHSMGNRALTEVLQRMSWGMESDEPLFDEVVLTAPDVDADHFRRDLVPDIVKTARRVTLYASSNDEALAVSKKLHGGHPRAGESGENIVVLPEIDTIDVSAVDTSFVGHSYYGDNTTVLADLYHLIHYSRAPAERVWLKPQPFEDTNYWVFLTDRIGNRPPAQQRR